MSVSLEPPGTHSQMYCTYVVDEFGEDDLPVSQNLPKYSCVCLGGTFDRIHRGHVHLLGTAAAVVSDGGQILVGIADGPLLVAKLHCDMIEPVQKRGATVEDLLRKYVEARGTTGVEIKTFRIFDPYGPAVEEQLSSGCLIVSAETLAGGHKVNVERRAKSLPMIDLVVVPLIKDLQGEKLSSSRIREEESQSNCSDLPEP